MSTTAAGPRMFPAARICLAAAPRICLAARLLVAIGLLALFVVVPMALPRAAAAEPGSTPFLSVRIDRVTPEVVTDDQ